MRKEIPQFTTGHVFIEHALQIDRAQFLKCGLVLMQFAPIGDALETRFALLEGGTLGVDDELEKMKRTMNAPSMRAQLSEKMNDYGYININVR